MRKLDLSFVICLIFSGAAILEVVGGALILKGYEYPVFYLL